MLWIHRTRFLLTLRLCIYRTKAYFLYVNNHIGNKIDRCTTTIRVCIKAPTSLSASSKCSTVQLAQSTSLDLACTGTPQFLIAIKKSNSVCYPSNQMYQWLTNWLHSDKTSPSNKIQQIRNRWLPSCQGFSLHPCGWCLYSVFCNESSVRMHILLGVSLSWIWNTV